MSWLPLPILPVLHVCRPVEGTSRRAAKQALEMFCSAVRTTLNACAGYECQEKDGIFMLAFSDAGVGVCVGGLLCVAAVLCVVFAELVRSVCGFALLLRVRRAGVLCVAGPSCGWFLLSAQQM